MSVVGLIAGCKLGGGWAMRLTRRTVMIGVAVSFVSTGARAEEISSPVPGKRVALRGYDPVSYFTDGRPVQGDPRFWYEFDDTVYIFAGQEHRTVFVADPDHFAPQFRGYCTLSVSEGEHDEGLPDYWTILDGKLFVFGKPFGPEVFAKDPATITAQARANWAALQTK
jgi:hypothetical protein